MSEELKPIDPIDLIDTLPIDTNTLEVAQQIINETDLDKVKDLTHLFNLNQSKKKCVKNNEIKWTT